MTARSRASYPGEFALSAVRTSASTRLAPRHRNRSVAAGMSRPRAQQRLAAFLFLAPACIMVAIYVVYPIISSISLSFYNWDGMTEKTFAGFDNYVELFHAPTVLYGAQEQCASGSCCSCSRRRWALPSRCI